ncbi:MAG: phosphatase PAP2 family protein [Mariniphaga sp.]|nr:phosphatase PAP2 family protein [Mariniphaga sp.]
MELFQGILEIDRQLFLFLNGFFNDFRDTLMFFITRKETWLPLYLIILFYVFKTFRSKGVIIIIFLLIGLVVSDQLSGIIKESVERLRPVYEPEIQHLVHNFFRKGGLYGFFSSHASNAFLLVTFTSYVFKNRFVKISLIVWALVVSYSRIYLGVHYPIDIIGGIVFGIFLGWLFFKILMFFENHFFIAKQPKIEKTRLSETAAITVFLVLLVIFCTMLILTRHLHHYQLL